MGQSLCSLPYSLYVILGGGLGFLKGWGEGEEKSQGYVMKPA